MEDEAASDSRPVAQTAAQAAVDRLGVPPARQGSSGSKRRQREDEPSRKKAEPQHAALARRNKLKLDALSRRFNFRISVRVGPYTIFRSVRLIFLAVFFYGRPLSF